MKRIMVRYRVKPDRAAENEQYVQAVFDQLQREQPAGLRYASFRLEDGVSFVHFVWNDGDEDPLRALSTFRAFTDSVKDRCDEPPVATRLIEVGSYGFAQEPAKR